MPFLVLYLDVDLDYENDDKQLHPKKKRACKLTLK